VSRLVSLSSEREGLRRQLRHAEDQLSHVTTLYHDAHETRLATSVRHFTEWTLAKVIPVSPETLDREDLLERIPRASSRDEMEPVLDALLQRVGDAKDQIGRHVHEDDTSDIDLDTLRQRGLDLAEEDQISTSRLWSRSPSRCPGLRRPFTCRRTGQRYDTSSSSDAVATDMRRLDEAIHEEHDSAARKRGLETEIVRLRSEIELVGSPVGVFPAIVILALYSVVGVVLPVVVMAANPETLKTWKIWVLAALFAGGLAAVLGYMFWYVRTLNEPIPPDGRST